LRKFYSPKYFADIPDVVLMLDENNKRVVAKTIHFKRDVPPGKKHIISQLENETSEATIHQHANQVCGDFVAKFEAATFDSRRPDQYLLVMEYLTVLNNQTREDAVSVAKHLIQGLRCLHANGVAHGDIKTDNLRGNGIYIDFGLSEFTSTMTDESRAEWEYHDWQSLANEFYSWSALTNDDKKVLAELIWQGV
jgi:serine/threonine protein kinase